MGWAVIAFGYIEFAEGIDLSPDELETTKELFRKDIGDYSCHEIFYNCTFDKGYISFMMEGNKGIDNTPLELICEEIKKFGKKFECFTNEFSESGEGFYYDSSESHREIIKKV